MRLRANRGQGSGFQIPALGASFCIVLIPAVLTFLAAFTDWDGLSPPRWVGLDNFRELADDRSFWHALTNNIQWMVIFLTIPMGIALVASAILRENSRRNAAFQTIFLLPYVISPVANALVWQNIMLDPVAGLAAFVRRHFFSFPDPLSTPSIALYTVAGVDVWHFWGYLAVVFTAAMRQIPSSQLEAAEIEGASGWQIFRFVTIPGIMPTIRLMFVITTIFSFLTFDYIYLMTAGGPGRSTEMLSTYAYALAFSTFEVGKAAAISLVMGFFGLLASLIYVRMSVGERR